jgi:hypothetical protein
VREIIIIIRRVRNRGRGVSVEGLSVRRGV